MRFLVIGGTAFMGPQVVRRLASRGHDVAVFHRGKTKAVLPPGVKEFLGDRRKLGEHAETLRKFRPDVVVDMMLVTEADARGLMTVFADVARRVVAVSSIDAVKAYGVLLGTEAGPPVPAPFDEDTPVREKLFPYRGKAPGMDDYDKVLVERECLAHPGLPAAVLRLPMVYGPGDRQHRLHELLRRFDAGRAAIALDGSIAPWRGCRGYVENVAEAIALAAEDSRSAGRVYNVAEEPTLEERAWVAAVAAAAEWKGRVVEVPSEKLPEPLRAGMNTSQHLWPSTARIRRELGYRETVGFEEGLKRTVAWERANPPAARPEQAETDAAEEKILRETGGL
ncbi:MAG: NAD-dependent epimerase/dehydratase family protein [Planctomycetes bacterium]|nr:NAD-dependent epimerase/dehydratase family protein [Planctomycetota bacterium]